MSRVFLVGLLVCSCAPQALAQTPSQLPYASTFQHTDVGVIKEDGTSGEKESVLRALAQAQPSTPPATPTAPVKTISVVNQSSTTKTRMYVWVDARGVKHYSDSPSHAPKGTKARVVVTHKPAYTPPPQTSSPSVPSDLPIPPQGPSGAAQPPTSLPPTSLPPLPPIL